MRSGGGWRGWGDEGVRMKCGVCGAVMVGGKDSNCRSCGGPVRSQAALRTQASDAPSSAAPTQACRDGVLRLCPDCGKEISRSAAVCIGCGRPMKDSPGGDSTLSLSVMIRGLAITLIGPFFLGVLIGLSGGSELAKLVAYQVVGWACLLLGGSYALASASWREAVAVVGVSFLISGLVFSILA